MGLVVALDDINAASGSLFWDEGDTVGEIHQEILQMLHKMQIINSYSKIWVDKSVTGTFYFSDTYENGEYFLATYTVLEVCSFFSYAYQLLLLLLMMMMMMMI